MHFSNNFWETLKNKEFNTYRPWSTEGRPAAHREVVITEREHAAAAGPGVLLSLGPRVSQPHSLLVNVKRRSVHLKRRK